MLGLNCVKVNKVFAFGLKNIENMGMFILTTSRYLEIKTIFLIQKIIIIES